MLITDQTARFFKLWNLKNSLQYNVVFSHVVRYLCKLQLNLVIFAGFGQACQGMSKALQNNKATISLGRILFICFYMQLHSRGIYIVIMSFQQSMVRHAQSSLKQQITNIFENGRVILLTFCQQLFASCQISIETTKTCYFGLALSGIATQSIRLSNVLNFKKSKRI